MSLRLAIVLLGGLAGAASAFPVLVGLGADASTVETESLAPAPAVVTARAVSTAAAPVAVEPEKTKPEPEPEPEPEPKPEPEAPEEETEDDGNESWVGPPDAIPDCEAKLEAAGVEFKPSRIPLHKTRSGIYCGAEQIVRYRRGPGAIGWGGSPQVTCPVALALAKLEGIVQEEAERHLGRKVRRIQHMGTYNCREMANYPGWVSEHSYANAIDIKHFELAGGKKIPVLGVYPRDGAEPKNDSQRFLKAVARRLFDERVFSVVLTPSFDAAHRNHFHLDMARYIVDGT